jgi:hypothetical protein
MHVCATQELVEHPFWKVKLPLLPLSAEPALEAYIKAHNLLPAHGRVSASEVRAGLRTWDSTGQTDPPL